MAVDQKKVNELIDLFERKFSSFENFNNPQFMDEEVKYKQQTIDKAKEILNRENLSSLIQEQDYDEFISRVKKIGKDNNLLWFSVPLSGDLNILHSKELDKASFCTAFYNLLFGEGASSKRLEQYLEYIKENNLPNKWTFPTYFLFICYPEEEYFVKPETTKWLMSFIDESDKWDPSPNPSSYSVIRGIVHELKNSLSSFQPKDIVDIQGFIWVCHSLVKDTLLSEDKRDKFLSLFQEFITSYSKSNEAEKHIKKLKESRGIGKRNFGDVSEAAERGEDITDLVLLKILPYSDTEPLRKKGVWISIAPVINGNIKKWFEKVGWTEPNNWPEISKAILAFFKRCIDNPNDLKEACREFINSPYSKGFQAGFLSPMLNALNPNDFKLINRKPINVLNFLSRTSHGQTLEEYPVTNKKITQLIEEVAPEMHQFDLPQMRDDDLFDLFCHWLNAIKKYDFEEIQYWKIAPGENAWNWKNCKEGSFIAIGWDELGDVSKMNRTDFNKKRDELVEKHSDWKKVGPNQVWEFSHHIKEGDQIIANHGKSKVLGIGTVIGPYNYVPNETHGHRISVNWDDLDPRAIEEPGWQRTLIKLNHKKFHEIFNAPIIETGPPDNGDNEVGEKPPTKYGCPFHDMTFKLLEELHNNPTRKLYSSKIEDFKKYVINPMRNLFQKVAHDLPDPIKDLMETKSKIFSRIPKNDFGRGGAWDYYWGAFYPQGGKRTEDAQLSIWINKDRFEYGFYIGEYGSEQRAKFLKNCRDNFEVLQTLIEECLHSDSILYGTRDELATKKLLKSQDRTSIAWDEWLKNPEESGIDVSGVISKDGILQMSETELTKQILDGFTRLFPLVLLATSDNPIPAINDYLEQIDIEIEIEKQPIYSLSKLASDTSIEEEVLQKWVQAIERKKQAILYGPPGTGKTYAAKLLAKHLISGSDGFYDIVQFHPAYAYEDFMQGIRPQTRSDGNLDFKLIPGRFLDFCVEAKKRSGKCVLIIDEINRANLARVFGELMYLLEYRDESIPLSQGENLSIPKNVNLIGTMNTADRSIALVDHALRRRFAFLPLYPNFDILREFHKNTDFPINTLIEMLERLNTEIDNKHYHVGITFFLNKNLKDNIEDIWKMEIEPYLEEYFYDQQEKAKEFGWVRIKDKLQ